VRLPIASIAVIAGLMVALLVAFLGAAAPALAQEQLWRHGIIEPKSDAGFQVMAVRGGFAARQGIRLELPYFQNDVIALRGLLAGELESYEGGAATAILAAARGGDVKIAGCHWQTVVHSVFARAEFKGPQDLKGATMAISAPNATPDMIGKAWLAQNNVPLSEVKFASLGNDPERYKAMLGGIALATVISIEFLPIGKNDGIQLVARGSDVMPKYLRLCTVTTGKLIASRREDAVRFLAAQMQGYRHALASREEELRITREITGIKADDPRPEFMFAEAARPDTGIDPRMPIVMDKLNWLQEQLLKAGNLAQPYDLGRIVNTDIRDAALARAGMGP
jgi:NitT/TauT family transport system substrate-binding protein